MGKRASERASERARTDGSSSKLMKLFFVFFKVWSLTVTESTARLAIASWLAKWHFKDFQTMYIFPEAQRRKRIYSFVSCSLSFGISVFFLSVRTDIIAVGWLYVARAALLAGGGCRQCSGFPSFLSFV